MYLLSTVSGGALTKGMKFWLKPSFYAVTYYDTTSNMSSADIMPSQYKYFGRSSTGTWYDLTPENGLFTAPARLNFVCVAANARGSSAINGHAYAFSASKLEVYVSEQQPDVVSAIEGQTEDINEQTEQSTNDILDGQEQQTDTLMDTTGSDDILDSGNMDDYRRFYNQLGPVGQLTEVANQLRSATNTTVASDIVLFPGISLMGFTIPSQQVTISDKMLGLVERIRWITTFCFVAMFIRYLRAFVAAVFGTEEIGLWVSRDEDVEVQQDNIRGFRALGRYYNTDVHHHGRIYR